MEILKKIEEDNVGYLRWKMYTSGLPTDPYYSGYSLLRFALCRERREVAKFLINDGCDVNPTRKTVGNTPLHIAVSKEDVEIIEMLLHRGASVENSNRHGETPLHYAVKTRNNEIIDMIVDKLLIVNREACVSFGLTPLHISCFRNDSNKVEFLLRSKPDASDLLSAKFCKSETETDDWKDNIQWSGYTALHFAIELECAEIVRILLRFGADVDATSSKGLTPLHLAAQKSQELVQLILKKRKSKKRKLPDDNVQNTKCADVNSVDCFGNTPLHYAIKQKKLNIVNLLIDRGADVCMRNNESSTLLHIAVRTGNNDIVGRVLSILKNHNEKIFSESTENLNAESLEIDSTDCLGNTALHYASESGSANLVGMLLDLEADVSLQNINGRTPIHLALNNYWTEVIRLLSAFDQSHNEKTNPMDSLGYSHFHAACLRGDLVVIKSFVNNGANINSTIGAESRKCPGYTPLHFAVENSSNKAVELLINLGADVDAKDAKHQTPLHLAAERANERAIILLLNHNVDPNAKTKFGVTPLHLAVRSRSRSVVQLLLKFGADVDARDNRGFSALHSDYLIDEDISTMLMKKATDLNFIDRKGETLLYKAIDNNRTEQIEILLDRNVDVNCSECEQSLSPLHLATRNKDIRLVNELLRRGARVCARTKTGRTPLHELTAKSQTDEVENATRIKSYGAIITSLLNYNCDLEGKTTYGKTALHYAITTRNVNAAIALLRQGADINAVDSMGKTPLSLAATCPHQFYTTRHFLRDHIFKMKMINFHISEENKASFVKIWNFNEPNPTFKKDCYDELKQLKRTVIDGNCTLYDILFKRARCLASLVEHTTFRKLIAGSHLDVAFPMFNFLIRLQFRRGLIERNRQNVVSFFADRGLPDLCSDKIIGYLPPESLNALVEAIGYGIPGFPNLNFK